MKVVFVSTIGSGGPVAHLLNMIEPISGLVDEVSVVCADEVVAARFRGRGVRATAVQVTDKTDLRGARRLIPHLRGADVVHTHDRRAGLFARVIGRSYGGVPVHTFHGFPEEIAARVGRPDAPLPPGVSRARAVWLSHGYMRIESLLARLGVVTTPSKAAARFLIDHGVPERRLHVIPSAIEVMRTEPREAHDPFVVGVVANLEHWKGVDVLIDACSRVGRPLRLEVVGDGERRYELEQIARRLQVDARFHGRVPEAREQIADFDLLVLPSRAESFGIVILEAMAEAVPVVATNVGGIPEIVVDDVTGRIVEPDDAPALARAIEEVMVSPELRERWGRAGARRAAKDYEPASIAGRYVDVYASATASASA